ncbi:hypothetical protein LU640_11930 [Pseudomonas monteilii]|uniref:hypothetical protein n=1 Tax=Pseudomonas TaxID=286 RepID=UPI0006D9AD6F|nr:MULTISPECIES: hypothetical protein [Pseudomonas]KPM60568.1 hypothetical protein HB4184_21290 [Pseudomonas putida]MCE1006726.1 hypothetical protein [Pseudomonas monteilii]MCE1018121.1 hypothetical protein [Pseudomonas monteilii]MCE1035003.1 hypothetical protein [Pseudomonas monteilii]MCE1087359.1 hypothetical protein [Pseudomonas monteilii]
MKKIVPDPPRHFLSHSPLFAVKSDINPPHALAHAIDLVRGVIETLDEHCLTHAGEPGLGNALYATKVAHSLVANSNARLFGQAEEE